MNEQLQNALSELIQKAVDGIDTTTGFLTDQLPDVIYQLLAWYGSYYFILFLVSVALISLSIVLFLRAAKGRLIDGHWARPENHYDGISFLGAIAFISSVLFSIAGFAVLNFQWLQIWIAPKIWLIEYATKLAN